MRKDNTKRKKPVSVILIALIAIVVIIGTLILISYIRQQQAEREAHRVNAVLHIEKGIYNIAEIAEKVIAFYMLIEQAVAIAEESDYEAAILIYETASQAAQAIRFTEGVELAKAGIEKLDASVPEFIAS